MPMPVSNHLDDILSEYEKQYEREFWERKVREHERKMEEYRRIKAKKRERQLRLQEQQFRTRQKVTASTMPLPSHGLNEEVPRSEFVSPAERKAKNNPWNREFEDDEKHYLVVG